MSTRRGKRREEEEESEEDDRPSLKRRIRILEQELKEATAERSSRKKIDAIFDTPPSDIDEEVFKVIYPFITVVRNSMPAYSHTNTQQQESKVFEFGGAYILAKVLEVADAWPTDGGNEEEDRHLMATLLGVVHHMSDPNSKDLSLVQGSVRYEDVADGPFSDSSEEDLQYRINRRAPFKKAWRMDMGCYTIKRKLRRIIEKEFPELVSSLDELEWAVKLVIECKEEAIKGRDIFQAFMYVINKIHARHDLGIPYDPVYAHVWTPLRWRLGLADIKGFVLVKNGRVDKVSREDYEKNLAARKERRGNKEDCSALLDSNDLDSVLSRTEARLMRRHGCRFRDGWYPVGTVYVDTKERAFPNLRTTTGPTVMDADAKFFFQVLMRTLLGNKWLRREPKDLIQAIATREKFRSAKRSFPAEARDFIEQAYQAGMGAMKDRSL